MFQGWKLEAVLISHVYTIKCIMCAQEKIELSSTSQTEGERNQNFRRSFVSYKDKVTITNCKRRPRVSKGWHPVA